MKRTLRFMLTILMIMTLLFPGTPFIHAEEPPGHSHSEECDHEHEEPPDHDHSEECEHEEPDPPDINEGSSAATEDPDEEPENPIENPDASENDDTSSNSKNQAVQWTASENFSQKVIIY